MAEKKDEYKACNSLLIWPGGSAGISQRQRRTSDGSEYRNSSSPLFYVGGLVDDIDDTVNLEKKVIVGICAMAKKSHSKPMKEIIHRLENFSRLQILIFDEDVIINRPVEEWPVVNAFISFFSFGFPLDKAIAYKNLRQPFVVNDLDLQKVLQDRTEVYRIMEMHNIPHPRYSVLNRETDPCCNVLETEDSIEINGQLHLKPFVEKPIDAENHNVHIYFPQAAGGGSTRLFRKVKDRSSVYSRASCIRRNGPFLYEDFMPTDGTDVKVYTVGTDYQHAEARKSPCLDGKVERDQEGKEIRYPVLLSAREKLISRKVVWAFGQNVCGFDLLRASDKCYVCDVNGFSFVKTSSKYYDDCARILGTMMLREVCPTLHIPFPVGPAPEDIPVVPTTSGPMMELRSVVALIRHGDRTPKQKMKMEVKNKLFFELFEKYGGLKNGHLKLKRPKQMQEVLDIVRHLLSMASLSGVPDLQDKKAKLLQMKLVLEIWYCASEDAAKVSRNCVRCSHSNAFGMNDCFWYGHFSGINRKVQLKYQPHGRPKRSSSEDDDSPRNPSLLLILKWGGELTPAGRIQAESLGKAFRTLYPGGQGQFEAPGLGFLRLHSTFRHDLKIYASDEGRVQMTAAAFTKGLLALEGELTPILVQMVKSANTNGLLDGEGMTSRAQILSKEKLMAVFNQKHDFTPDDYCKLNSTNASALTNAMNFVRNPQEMCHRVYVMICEITAKIRALKSELKCRELPLYNGESWELFIRRWAKLEKDFQLKGELFEISKIPDVYDCIKYDLQHNQKTLQYERANELFMCSKALADIIVPQEYGITREEKLYIGQNYCSPFLRKMRCDFLQVINSSAEDSTTRLDSRYSKGVASPERFVRTRLYFTSESHIHSMLNMLRYGNLFEAGSDSQWETAVSFLDATAELNYMSQIVFMFFEDPSKEMNSDDRYHMELHFSPGAYTSCDEPTEPRGMGYRPRHSFQADNSADGKPSVSAALSSSGHLPSAVLGNFKAGLIQSVTAPNLGDIFECDVFELTSTTKDFMTVEGQHLSFDVIRLSLTLTSGNINPSFIIQHNYKTVHLPLHDLSVRRSLPCVFNMGLTITTTCPTALENFVSYVPQLHPLETLHNTLTFREIDDFLGRVTGTRFQVPSVSAWLHSSDSLLLACHSNDVTANNSPSINSSPGPSTPTSLLTHMDLISSLRLIIDNSSKATDSELEQQLARSGDGFQSFAGSSMANNFWTPGAEVSGLTRQPCATAISCLTSDQPVAAAGEPVFDASDSGDDHFTDALECLSGAPQPAYGAPLHHTVHPHAAPSPVTCAALSRSVGNRFSVLRIQDDDVQRSTAMSTVCDHDTSRPPP